MISSKISRVEARSNHLSAKGGSRICFLDLRGLEAVLFDLDGVVTETAKVHAQAWKRTFDDYLEERAARLGGTFHPFDLDRDYKSYVDGKPRYDGVASFLRSRDIYLPPGEESDPPHKETVCGLGSRKNKYFLEAIRRDGVSVYPTSVDFVRRVKAQGLKAAVVSSSRNCTEILKAAGIADLFDAQVDGNVAREWMLGGKPAPDTYLEAAHRVGVDPRRACVIEDAVAGVEAGKAGEFRLVIGVCRNGHPELLEKSGADIVVSDLSELAVGGDREGSPATARSALEHLAEIWGRTLPAERQLERLPDFVAQDIALDTRKRQEITVEKVVALYTSHDAAISEPGLAALSRTILDYLREKAPFYIYSNPITPGEAAAAVKAVDILDSPEGATLLRHLREMTARFEAGLGRLGLETIPGEHPVVPLMVRNTQRTAALVRYLRVHGVLATAITYPVVPCGEEEIRFQVSADHTAADIDEVLDVLAGAT
jgi:alpha,alpha-trehalase